MNGHSKWVGKEHSMYDDLILIYREFTTHGFCEICFEKEMLKNYDKMSKGKPIISSSQ